MPVQELDERVWLHVVMLLDIVVVVPQKPVLSSNVGHSQFTVVPWAATYKLLTHEVLNGLTEVVDTLVNVDVLCDTLGLN